MSQAGGARGVAPKVLALAVCEMIVRDEGTKNLSLIGLFNTITAPKFPARHDRLHVFVSLSQGHGVLPCMVRILDPDEKSLFEAPGQVKFDNPLGVVDANFEVRGLVLPKPGTYVVEFRCQDEVLLTRRFEVIQASASGE